MYHELTLASQNRKNINYKRVRWLNGKSFCNLWNYVLNSSLNNYSFLFQVTRKGDKYVPIPSSYDSSCSLGDNGASPSINSKVSLSPPPQYRGKASVTKNTKNGKTCLWRCHLHLTKRVLYEHWKRKNTKQRLWIVCDY